MHRGKLLILQVLSCPKLSTVPMFLALQHESIRVHREMTRKNVLKKIKDKGKKDSWKKTSKTLPQVFTASMCFAGHGPMNHVINRSFFGNNEKTIDWQQSIGKDTQGVLRSTNQNGGFLFIPVRPRVKFTTLLVTQSVCRPRTRRCVVGATRNAGLLQSFWLKNLADILYLSTLHLWWFSWM